jgi:FtsZ-binding cell division protein ZapB
MTPTGRDSDSLSNLEERIQLAIQLVARLRKEKEAALAASAEAMSQKERLAEEVAALQAERKQVRARIEKLLGQIDQLGAG